MINLSRLTSVYLEGAGGEGDPGGGGGTPPAGTPPATPPAGTPPATPPAGAPPATPELWQYAEGIDGMGDRPEFFLPKFTNMSEQAKAYTELEKRFGGFTGAPEKYDDVEGANAFVAAAIQNVGADLNLDGAGYEKLVKEISTAVDGAADAQYEKDLADAEANIPNFDRRQKQLAAATLTILTPEQLTSLDKAIITPEGFAAVEALVGAAAGILPGITTPASVETAEGIAKQIAALDPSDVNTRNDLVKKMNDLFGDGEGKLV